VSAPEVSVVIPTYNSARYLPAAIESVLVQTFKDHEILVVDDGSTDDTPRIVDPFRPAVRYLRQPNRGVAAARNRGLAESRGRYVAFLDADDTWLPTKLEKQTRALAEAPSIRASYSAFFVVDEDLRILGVRRGPAPTSLLTALLTQGNVVGSICTVLCERPLFDLAGGFDPALSQCADWDMWVRLALGTEFLYLDEPLATYRQHSTNMSRNVARLEHDSLRLLEAAFLNPALPPPLRPRRREAFGRNYRVLAGSYFGVGQYRDFLRCAYQALRLDPRQIGYFLAFPARFARRALKGLAIS